MKTTCYRGTQCVVACVLSVMHVTSLYSQSQLPRSTETIASDARGFGALKILVASEEIREDLKIQDNTNDLESLLNSCEKRISELQNRNEWLSRREIIIELDRWLEPRIEKIINDAPFKQYSRFVFRQRLLERGGQFHILLTIIQDDSLVGYLSISSEADDLRNRIFAFCQANNQRNFRREALLKMCENVSTQTVDRLRDILGDALVPNPTNRPYPSLGEIPILSSALTDSSLLQASDPVESMEIFKGDQRIIDTLYGIHEDRKKEKARRERLLYEAVREKKRPTVEALTAERELDALALDDILRVLSKKHLGLLSRHRAQRDAQMNLSSFFSDRRIHDLIGNPEDSLSLSSSSAKLEKEIAERQKIFYEELMSSFVKSLDPGKKRKLALLIELE